MSDGFGSVSNISRTNDASAHALSTAFLNMDVYMRKAREICKLHELPECQNGYSPPASKVARKAHHCTQMQYKAIGSWHKVGAKYGEGMGYHSKLEKTKDSTIF